LNSKNKIKWFIFPLLISLVAVFIYGCGKGTTTNMLVGRWSKINTADIDDTTFYENWEFVGDGSMYIHFHPPGPNDKPYKGIYTVLSYNKFRITDDSPQFPPQYIGTWQIVKRKQGTLRIVHKIGGLLFCEFTKN
jgi:hypothetical protein